MSNKTLEAKWPELVAAGLIEFPNASPLKLEKPRSTITGRLARANGWADEDGIRDQAAIVAAAKKHGDSLYAVSLDLGKSPNYFYNWRHERKRK